MCTRRGALRRGAYVALRRGAGESATTGHESRLLAAPSGYERRRGSRLVESPRPQGTVRSTLDLGGPRRRVSFASAMASVVWTLLGADMSVWYGTLFVYCPYLVAGMVALAIFGGFDAAQARAATARTSSVAQDAHSMQQRRSTMAFLRVNFLMTLAMVIHSGLLVSPGLLLLGGGGGGGAGGGAGGGGAGVPASSDSSLLSLDMLATTNAMHAVFVVGTASLYYTTHRLHYWWMMAVGHVFVCLIVWRDAVLASALGPSVRTSEGAATLFVCWSHALLCAACCFQLFRVRSSISVPADDQALASLVLHPPSLRLLHTCAKALLLAEAAWYAATVLGTGVACWLARPHWGFASSLHMLVEDYTQAIHLGVILGQGAYGVLGLRPELLLVFGFSSAIFGALNLAQLVPSAWLLVRHGSWAVLPAVLALVVICGVRLCSVWCAFTLRKALANQANVSRILAQNIGTGTDVVRGRSIFSMARDVRDLSAHLARHLSQLGWATLGLFAVWVAECFAWCLFSWLNNATESGMALWARQLTGLGAALNFGVHGIALFHLQHYKIAESRLVFRNRRHLHASLGALLCLTSAWEALAVVLVAVRLGAERRLLVLGVLVTLRALACGLVGYLFFSLQLGAEQTISTILAQQYARGVLPSGAELEALMPPQAPVASDALAEDSWLPFLYAIPAKLQPGECAETHVPPSPLVQRMQARAFFMLLVQFALFCALAWLMMTLLVLQDSPSVLAVPRNPNTHTVAYGIVFHFCYVVTGFGYRGLSFFNLANVVVVRLNAGLVGALLGSGAVLSAALLAARPAANNVLSGWLVLCACAAGAIVCLCFWRSAWLVERLVLLETTSDISPIW